MESGITFTSDERLLDQANFFVVAVPTPISTDYLPDLHFVIGAMGTVGRYLHKEDVVVLESTVYPGVTEDVCVPVLEKASSMVCGKDFFVGYSPERINPGDVFHRIDNSAKLVSGMDEQTLSCIRQIYGQALGNHVVEVASIRVAEAAKLIENVQRDMNIAFVNEIAMLFHRMGMRTSEVLEAAGTKWNFLNFRPGLVGGHCIGVDSYYLMDCANRYGEPAELVAAGRQTNERICHFLVEQVLHLLGETNLHAARIGVLGVTFKEDCPDIRNSKIFEVIRVLRQYGVEVLVCDNLADAAAVKQMYGTDLSDMTDWHDLDGLILAVPHNAYLAEKVENLLRCLRGGQSKKPFLMDIKSVMDPREVEAHDVAYWSL